MRHSMVVIGGSPAALSLATDAQRAGLDAVPVLVRSPLIVPPESVRGVTVRHLVGVPEVSLGEDDLLQVLADGEILDTGVCVLDSEAVGGTAPFPWPVPETLTERVHSVADFEADDRDVLVVGRGDEAVVQSWRLAEERARVVLCFTGLSTELSRIAIHMLDELEREQRATVLWRSAPVEIVDVGGFPMALFPDRRTPDLQFDHVLTMGRQRRPSGVKVPEELDEKALYLLAESQPEGWSGKHVAPSDAWSTIRRSHFPDLPALRPRHTGEVDDARARELARAHYNATITAFDTAHNELWRIRIRPDRETGIHRAGQYCSLGIGLWEPRADDEVEPRLASNREKLVRRSYSISSPIFDDNGYLADHVEMDEIELYIVWVRSAERRVSSLTPRMALKKPGDRVYLGPKIAGRYTLSRVVDPAGQIVFCATGTGEAPHNAMIVELLRKGHHGPIVSAVTVRHESDLAYREEHRGLAERFPNYRYLAHPTRDPNTPRRYVQDLLRDGDIEEALGDDLDPHGAHVFLCGNPAMIGLPEWEGPTPSFPGPTGMAELLHDRGMTLDRRGVGGNVHYEEYW